MAAHEVAQSVPDLIALVERIEAAARPDRELDCLIAYGMRPEGISFADCAPRYTASLDAAMTLVPEGWTAWELRSRRGRTRFVAEVSREDEGEPSGESVKQSHAATPALALCAASLRARSTLTKD